MRIHLLPVLALLALPPLAFGCASSSSSLSSEVRLGPGGRAEGRFTRPAGEGLSLRLENLGPGGVDFVVRGEGGRELGTGNLGHVTLLVPANSEDRIVVVVLEARGDGPVAVSWSASGRSGADVEWDLSRAHP